MIMVSPWIIHRHRAYWPDAARFDPDRYEAGSARAGRAAEELEYGEAASGISSDLAYASTLASQLVGQLGNGPGLMSLEAAATPGAANLVAKVLSDEPSREAAEGYLTEAADRAAWMVEYYRSALHEIADVLCENDEVEGERITEIVARYTDVTARRGPVRIKHAS